MKIILKKTTFNYKLYFHFGENYKFTALNAFYIVYLSFSDE